MSDKPCRFWQIHLSTAVLVSVTLALIIAANFAPYTTAVKSGVPPHDVIGSTTLYGWPFYAMSPQHSIHGKTYHFTIWYWNRVTYNALIALIAPLLMIFLSEYLIRRRSRP